MRADSALSAGVRVHEFPDARLTRDANLLIMPNVDAANITYNALRATTGEGITVGGFLLGLAQPVHILTPSSTVRRIVNMAAVASADAGSQRSAACLGLLSSTNRERDDRSCSSPDQERRLD